MGVEDWDPWRGPAGATSHGLAEPWVLGALDRPPWQSFPLVSHACPALKGLALASPVRTTEHEAGPGAGVAAFLPPPARRSHCNAPACCSN